MYCRGHQLREEICKNYDVKPVGRFKLLNGSTVISDAGNMDITDEYIIFDCISKSNSAYHETIYCGRYVADDFCSITGYSLPPLFDPLHHDHKSQTQKNPIDCKTKNQNFNIKWNPCRKQLYDITLILICYFGNLKVGSPLFNIKEKLESYISFPPHLSYIKGINTIISKTNKTFVEILIELSEKNDLRVFKYDLVLNELNSNNIKSYLE